MPTASTVRWVFLDSSGTGTPRGDSEKLTIYISKDKSNLYEHHWEVYKKDIACPDFEQACTDALKELADSKGVQGIKVGTNWGRGNVYLRCSYCLEFIYAHLAHEIRWQWYCGECARKVHTCYLCEETGIEGYKQDSHDRWACQKCQEFYTICPSCGVWRDNSRTDEKCPECIRSRCQMSLEERDQLLSMFRRGEVGSIHDYSHKPFPKFHKTEGQTTLLYEGVELEVDNFDDRGIVEAAAVKACQMSKDEDLFYLKYDASIHSGFEVVTHPCTLKFHKEQFPWVDLTKTLVALGGRSHQTTSCGLHIHFSSEVFGRKSSAEWQMNVLKLMHFVTQNWRQLVKFSRRSPDNLRSWASRYIDDYTPTPDNIRKVGQIVSEHNRHRAINLCPSETIEVRIFKGTLNVETIIASLEFIDHLANWIVAASPEKLHNITWDKYVADIEPATYPTLLTYLRRRKLCA